MQKTHLSANIITVRKAMYWSHTCEYVFSNKSFLPHCPNYVYTSTKALSCTTVGYVFECAEHIKYFTRTYNPIYTFNTTQMKLLRELHYQNIYSFHPKQAFIDWTYIIMKGASVLTWIIIHFCSWLIEKVLIGFQLLNWP